MESKLATVTDLPTELLQLIFGHLNAKELYSISLLSRRLHHIALPLHLSCWGIHEPHNLTFSSGSRSMRGLPGLRIALFVTSIDYLKCSFGFLDDPNVLLNEIREVSALVQKPSLTNVGELFLDFRNVAFWRRSKGRAQMRTTTFVLDRWANTFGGLLNALASKSCRKLTVRGGGLYSSQAQDSDIMALSLPATSGSMATINASTSLAIVRNIFRASAHGESLSNKAQKPTMGQRFSVWRRGPPHGGQPTNEFQPRALGTLTTFNLESFLLLHQPFLSWTIMTLNTSFIQCLTIDLDDLRMGTWPVFLSFLALPSLRRLSIHQSRGLLFTDFISFLSRHPTIQTLVLRNGTLSVSAPDPSPSKSSRHPVKSLLYLPNLTSFHAPPAYIANIMALKLNPDLDPFPKLDQIVSFFSNDDCYTHALDRALASLSLASHIPGKSLYLHLQVTCDDYFVQWIMQKVKYPGSLRCVTSIQLEALCSIKKEVALNLPGWLATFPGLRHLALEMLDEMMDRKERLAFVHELKLSCPELMSMAIGTDALSMETWIAEADKS